MMSLLAGNCFDGRFGDQVTLNESMDTSQSMLLTIYFMLFLIITAFLCN